MDKIAVDARDGEIKTSLIKDYADVQLATLVDAPPVGAQWLSLCLFGDFFWPLVGFVANVCTDCSTLRNLPSLGERGCVAGIWSLPFHSPLRQLK
jgi:hypothetical protein